MKWLKRLLWLVLALIVIVLATPFLIVQLTDPAVIKSQVATHISDATGRAVQIEGDVKLTAYPWLGAQIGATTVGNPAGFDAPYFAKFEGADVRVDLMGLLKSEMRMDTVTLNGVHIILTRKADGSSNWSEFAQDSGDTAQQDGTNPFSVLALGGISIQDGRVDWVDAVTGQAVSVSKIALTTGMLDLSDLSNARLETEVDAALAIKSNKPNVAGNLNATAGVTYDTAKKTLQLAGLTLRADANGKAVGGALAGTLAGDVAIALEQGTATITGLRLTDGKIQQGGTKAVLAASASTFAVGSKAVSADSLVVKVSKFSGANGLNGVIDVTTGLKAQLDSQVVALTKASAKGSFSDGALGGSLPFDISTNSIRFSVADGSIAIVGALAKLVNFDVAQTQGSATVAGEMGYSINTSDLISNNLRAAVNFTGRAARGGRASVTLTGALRANVQGKSAALSNMQLVVKELQTLGVTGSAKASGNVAINLASQVFSANRLDVNSNLAGPKIPGGKLAANFTLSSSTLNVAKESLRVRSFAAGAFGMKASGAINMAGLNSTPTFDGNVVIAPFSPRKLLQRLGEPAPRTADPKALQRASMNTFFSGTSALLKLKKTKITVDQTTLRGSASIANLKQPNYKFNLRADRLNVSRYTAPKHRNKAASPGAAAAAAAALPLETLRRFNANGSLAINDLRLAGLRISKAKVAINAKNGLIRVTPARANLYGGTYAGNIRLDARGKTAVMSFDEKLTQVDVGRLLQDLKGKAALTGTGTASAKLETRGANGRQLLSGLNGITSFRIDQGSIRKIDIVRSICTLVEGGQGGETRFDALTGSAQIVNGVIENDALNVSSPLLRIAARGIVDLPRDALDYRGDVGLVGTCKGQGGRVRGRLNGVDIPIRVTGSIANPKPSLDTSRVLESLARREIERKSERITKKLQEKVGEKAGKALGDTAKKVLPGLLKGLFGN
jgi:AsmA protein